MKEKNEILQSLIDYYSNGNKRQFAFMIGMSPSGISTWLLRNTFNADILIAKCKHLNPNYLLRGEGPIVISELPNEENSLLNEKKYDYSSLGVVSKNDTTTKDVNEVLAAAHSMNELTRKNFELLEKTQQQFDRVLQLYEETLSLRNRLLEKLGEDIPPE